MPLHSKRLSLFKSKVAEENLESILSFAIRSRLFVIIVDYSCDKHEYCNRLQNFFPETFFFRVCSFVCLKTMNLTFYVFFGQFIVSIVFVGS